VCGDVDNVKCIGGGGDDNEEGEALVYRDADSGAAAESDVDDEKVGGEGIATRTATVIKDGLCPF